MWIWSQTTLETPTASPKSLRIESDFECCCVIENDALAVDVSFGDSETVSGSENDCVNESVLLSD